MTINKTLPKRIPYIDVAKGILIMFVVLLHSSDVTIKEGVNNIAFNLNYKLSNFYLPFFMPAFFVITGLCSSFNKPFKLFLWSNFRSIVFPVIVVMVPFMLIKEHQLTTDFIFIKSFSRWFCIVLFLSKLTYWGICRVLSNIWQRMFLLLLLMALAVFLHFFFGQSNNIFCYCHSFALTFFLSIGEMIRRYKIDEKKILIKYGIVSTIIYIIFLGICIICLHKDIPSITYGFSISPKQIPLYLVLSITGSIMILYIARIINSNFILSYLGRETLTIYIFHYFFIRILLYIFKPYINNNSSLLASILVFIVFYFIVLSLSLLIARVLDWKYLQWIKGKF